MVWLKPLYSRLDGMAQHQSTHFSAEAQQEHQKMSYISIKKD